MTRRDPGPPRRLQDGSRVAYLERIGEVKPAKRLGKKVGRGLPPASRAPPTPAPRPRDADPPTSPPPAPPRDRRVVSRAPAHGASRIAAHQPHIRTAARSSLPKAFLH